MSETVSIQVDRLIDVEVYITDCWLEDEGCAVTLGKAYTKDGREIYLNPDERERATEQAESEADAARNDSLLERQIEAAADRDH